MKKKMPGNTIITQKQARQITGGRIPNMPVEYEAAVKALQMCIDLDDAKYWSDKADALAAWAKIYRSRDAELKAKQLKLRAYRRMGELAAELRPQIHLGRHGSTKGPKSLLVENGLVDDAARQARYLAELPAPEFDALLSRSRPPSPSTVVIGGRRGSETYKAMQQGGLRVFVTWTRRFNAVEAGRSLRAEEAKWATDLIVEATEWLDTFEQALPKDAK